MTQVLLENKESKLWVEENFLQKGDVSIRDLRKLPLQKKPPIMVRGKMCKQNRNVGFFSDESEGYHYSNQKMPSLPLSTLPLLEPLLIKVNGRLGTNFNGILVNHYENGCDYVGAHSDDEKTLDKRSGKEMVACISFGTKRKFRVREKKGKHKILLDYKHKPLSLLVMEGKFQKDFLHEIPQEKKILTDRISLTFRHHIQ